MQGFYKYKSVESVDEIQGFLDQSGIHEKQIHSAEFSEKDYECKYSRVGRQNNGQKDQSGENGLSPLPVSRQNICQGYSEQC